MKGSNVAGGCGTVLFGLVMVLSLLHDLFRGRLDLSEFIGTIRVRCGSSKWVSSMKMVNVACGVAVLLFGLAMALCLFLLLAGDVERNPGPNGGNLTMEDLPVLVTKLTEIAGKWHLLGVQLKFTTGTLDGFPPAIQADPIRALQELLTRWLQRKDPQPTLEALSDAVGGPVIGNELLAGNLLERRESLCGGFEFELVHSTSHVMYESIPAAFHGDTSNLAGTGVSDHHDLSSRSSVNTTGTASQSGSPGPGAFWCPCGKCSLDSFLLNGCPQVCSSIPQDPLFPFLDTKGLSPEDKEDLEHKLIKETREMILKFGSLVNKTSSSLIKQGVTHQELASCLIHLQGFVADIGQTIVGDHQEEIIRACSVGEVFLILGKYRYWSFLNYEILEHVINELGNSDSKGHLTKYNHDFKDFCQRSAFQVPSQVYSDKATRPKFAVKFDETVLNMLENACQAKRKVAEALGVKSSALFLCCVETGCIKVHFLIPDCIAKKVLPPSRDQLAALREASVQFLEFDGKEYICQELPGQESEVQVLKEREATVTTLHEEFESLLQTETQKCTTTHKTGHVLPSPVQLLPVQTVPRPAGTVARPAETVLWPSQTIPRPAQTVPRPVQTVLRPLQTVPRPAQTVPRPVQTVLRPLQTVLRPLQTVLRPAQIASRTPETVPKPLQTVLRPVQIASRLPETVPRPAQTVPTPAQTVPTPVQDPIGQETKKANTRTRFFRRVFGWRMKRHSSQEQTWNPDEDVPDTYTTLKLPTEKDTYTTLKLPDTVPYSYFSAEVDPKWEFPRENIQLTEVLNEGQFTILYKGVARGLKEKPLDIAVKSVRDDATEDDVRALIAEMELLASIGDHPNIISLICVCTIKKPIYMVVEYMCHGDLLGFLRNARGHHGMYTVLPGTNNQPPCLNLSSKDLLSISVKIANGMRFLADRKIVHRALCCRNVLVGIGFGIKIYNVGAFDMDNRDSLLLKWMAPETLFDGTNTTYSDVWSFGVTLWELVTVGGTPYAEILPEDLYTQLHAGMRMPKPLHCAQEVYDVMRKCWEHNPTGRPHFSDILDRLDSLAASKVSYLDLHNYNAMDYSQYDEPPQLSTAL